VTMMTMGPNDARCVVLALCMFFSNVCTITHTHLFFFFFLFIHVLIQ
jgi:hypothetical protein